MAPRVNYKIEYQDEDSGILFLRHPDGHVEFFIPNYIHLKDTIARRYTKLKEVEIGTYYSLFPMIGPYDDERYQKEVAYILENYLDYVSGYYDKKIDIKDDYFFKSRKRVSKSRNQFVKSVKKSRKRIAKSVRKSRKRVVKSVKKSRKRVVKSVKKSRKRGAKGGSKSVKKKSHMK